MSKLDVYYRGFKNYRKETKKYAECKKERSDLKESNVELDILNSTKFICSIEEDWIEEIEKGLEFVEKAVAEERQFIRVNGEIVPIEKVKKVSRSSIEHLAKHSNMITHVPKEEQKDLVPDNLYIVEKLSDYAVYENRFLYMLLSYLNEFIFFRLDKIDQLRKTYIGNMSYHKEIKTKKREFFFETRLYEKRLDNPYPLPDEKTEQLIERIKNCQQIVNALLNTNLMVEVSKTPMIKPPITKTNVLKMNNNFKNALALYEYISAYKGLGYSYEESKQDFTPFEEDVADELMDSIGLTSFLSYKVCNNLDGVLETAYQEEEKRRLEEEAKKLDERIKKLRKKARESNMTMEEYMILLETRNQQLLSDSEELVVCKNEILNLNKKIDDLNLQKDELNRQIDSLSQELENKILEIAALNQKYIDDMEALRQQHIIDIENIKKEYNEEINRINLEHNEEIDRINLEHQNEITDLHEDYARKLEEKDKEYEEERSILIDNYEDQIKNINSKHKNEINSYEEKLKDINNLLTETKVERNNKVNEYESKIKELESNYSNLLLEEKKTNERLDHEKALIRGELNAIRVQSGLLTPSEDYTSRERFIELEAQFEAFNKYFIEQWKLTKKQIRKEILGSKTNKTK